MNDFESKVLAGLKSGARSRHLGFAVSGGADSIAMITAAASLLKENKISAEKLFVITVNHFIRPDEETCGDADFVLDYCKKLSDLGIAVEAFCYALKKGQVAETSEQRGGGIEDAARFLRYQQFEKFIKDKNIDYLCLAHNQNDQLETLVMRFLQGSTGIAAAGIKSERDFYLRPLLNISRKEIEDYLISKNISWRTDSTNLETEYLRNRIRNNLIPLLNEQFQGWQTGVLNGAQKQLENSKVIQRLVDEIQIETVSQSQCAVQVSVSLAEFFKYGSGVQIPLLLKMCNMISSSNRVPYVFLKDFCNAATEAFTENEKNDFTRRFCDLEICCKKNGIIVKKYVKTETDLCFFGIIEETGNYEFPFGQIGFENSCDGKVSVVLNGNNTGVTVALPVCVRNAQAGDVVLTAEGNYKKVADVFSDWKAGNELRELIPVIQDLSENQRIKCIFGQAAGFNNWIVKE